MKKYTHYGVEVVCQQLIDTNFKSKMKKEGVKCTELPILKNEVLVCEKDGVVKYACIIRENAPDTCIENVYITTSIPLDMSWEKLVLDCQAQQSGAAPMQIKTKAKLICEEAEKMAMNQEEGNWFNVPELNSRDFTTALAAMGYDIDDIMDMDHHDISVDFLRRMGVEL